MKIFTRLAVGVLLLTFISRAFAVTGDTTHITVMDKYLWTWYGSQDRWAKFPDSSKSYEKILLRYTLTCPTGGCGEWDYTTGIILRHHTGKLDSTMQDAPSFTVNGGVQDSIRISHDTTRSYTYNTTTKKTDSAANAPLLIRYFNDPNYAFKQTGSIYVWQAGYWNYIFDNTGKKKDSLWVKGDATFRVTKKKAYFVFEVIVPYELTRYITPYGKVFPKDWTRTWTMDVTDYAYLLRDSVELRSFYDGYSQGSLYTLSFDLIEGIPSRKTYRADPIYNGYFTYGSTSDLISNHLPERKLFHSFSADLMTLRLIVTGHGNSDPSGACEFIDKTHSILVNGSEKYTQHLWRDDCSQNFTYPQTGTYWFSRAGWCPGDLVYPWDYEISSFSKKGDSVAVEYRMEDYTSPSPGGGYNVNGVVFYSSGPNFTRDAAIEDIKQPNSDPRFARANPICNRDAPIIVLRNNGSEEIITAQFSYGIDGNMDNSFDWVGSLGTFEKTEIRIQGINLGDTGKHTFQVKVVSVNGKKDQYDNNNTASVQYVTTPMYSNKIALALKIDKAPAATGVTNSIRWELKDANGALIKDGSGYDDAQLVRDTFKLASGCYKFIIYDEGFGEGLMPWALGTGYANGYYSLRDDKNKYIINATSSNYLAEFGNREETTFSVGSPNSVSDKPKQHIDFTLYPNPGGKIVKVNFPDITEPITISVFDMLGKELILKQSIIGASEEILDLGTISDGSYIIRIESENFRASKIYIKQ